MGENDAGAISVISTQINRIMYKQFINVQTVQIKTIVDAT